MLRWERECEAKDVSHPRESLRWELDMREWQSAVESRERRSTKVLQCAITLLFLSLVIPALLWIRGPTQLQCAKVVSSYCEFPASPTRSEHIVNPFS